MGNKMGHYAFLAGVLLAIIVGLFPDASKNYSSAIVIVLVVLGLIVGFLNVTAKESTEFLVAAIALMGGGAALEAVTVIPVVGSVLYNILLHVAVFVAPAALIVALKAIKNLAESK